MRLSPDHGITSPLPAAPPLEALGAVEGAARLSRTLTSAGYELRFGAGPGCRPIELRATGGALLRTLTPAEALDWITGG